MKKINGEKRRKMLEIGLCLGLLIVMLGMYAIFGKLAAMLLKIRLGSGMCILLGTFVYHGVFQIVALPLILLKQPLSLLTGIWLTCLVMIVLAYFFGVRMVPELGFAMPKKLQQPTFIWEIMLLLVLIQGYYMITSEYMGWDTSFYVGTIETSVNRNSMYLFNGETGRKYARMPFRYALSSFYIHSAVWCQSLRIMGIHYAKIVQGGVLAVLSNLTIYEIGKFLFSAKRYENVVKKEKIADCAAGMVMAVIIIHLFWDSIYSASDFLLQRALEAKAYCANLILPCIFLFLLMIWREQDDRTAWICLGAAAWSSVAISMSALMIVPVMIGIMILPLIRRKNLGKLIKCYVFCVWPNVLYLLLYLLNQWKIIGIEV